MQVQYKARSTANGSGWAPRKRKGKKKDSAGSDDTASMSKGPPMHEATFVKQHFKEVARYEVPVGSRSQIRTRQKQACHQLNIVKSRTDRKESVRA